MKIHQKDYDIARKISEEQSNDFPFLTDNQCHDIDKKSASYQEWFNCHTKIHNIICIFVTTIIFFSDFIVLLKFPELFTFDPKSSAIPWQAIVIGILHGWLMCGLATYFVHEVSAHNMFFRGKSSFVKWFNNIGKNICRLSFADPHYYSQGHRKHHQYFTTEKDGSFSNFVDLRRLLLSLIPAAPLMSFSDFFPWRPQEKTPSRRLSSILGKVYVGFYAVIMIPKFGIVYSIIVLIMAGSWMSYIFDRLRESTEHFMMPMDKHNGTRQLGLGFWGLLLGGGPWGQPCHMSHHLAPGLPWYLQIRLHFYLKRILTPEQKKVFFLTPFIGFPKLFIKLVKTNMQIKGDSSWLVPTKKTS